MRLLAPIAGLALFAPTTAFAQAQEILPGASYEFLEPEGIPARIHLVTLDLTASELRFEATPPEERGQRTSAWASGAGVAIATNGGAFSPVDFSPYGTAVGGGVPWPDDAAEASRGSLVFERAGPRTEGSIAPPEAPPSPENLDAAIAGGPLLVEAGTAREDFDCGDSQAMPCERAPRTAAALAAGGTRLLVAVVEGWQEESAGATAAELAPLLVELGADDALLLDGGSASTLFADPLGGLVSAPSDGAERRVANHLGIGFEELEPGTMTVLVRERDVFDPDANIAGATVTLDEGQQGVTGEEGEVDFAALRPRLVCATAQAEGYDPASECQQVPPGESILNAIALFPEGEGSDVSTDSAAEGPHRASRGRTGGCRAAPGRLQGGSFHVTLSALLAAAIFAAAACRRSPAFGRRHR